MASKMALAGSGGNPQAASNFLSDSLKMATARLEAFQSVGDILGLDLTNIYNVSHTAPALNITDQIQKVRRRPHALWPQQYRSVMAGVPDASVTATGAPCR